MKVKSSSSEIEFAIIPIVMIKRNIESVFYQKNNKTLKQTLDHEKYNRVHRILTTKYENFGTTKLGDFMKICKESNDKNYLLFLNKYGDEKFCQFKIEKHLDDKGIYCFIKNNRIMYLGRCTDNLKKRINQGYGTIHPKNCFLDGQATNCHVNSLINQEEQISLGFYEMNQSSADEIKSLEKELLQNNNFDWNIQSS